MLVVFYIIFIFLGLAIGSFVNALVWRVHSGVSIVHGRSQCPTCHAQLAWYDNIPLLSFVMLCGKCRSCARRISWQYPVVEFIVGALFAVAFWFAGAQISSPLFWYTAALMPVLVFIFVYDARYKEIHTQSTLYPALFFLLFALNFRLHTWQSMLIGTLIAAGFFFFQYVVSKGRWIGGGDVRYGVLMGVVLGWPHTLVGLLFAYVIGAVVSIIEVALGKKTLASETPFGTSLVIGTCIALFWGSHITAWYLGLFI